MLRGAGFGRWVIGVALLALAFLAGSLAQAADDAVIVSGTDGLGVNLRQSPDITAPVLAHEPEGTSLVVIGADRQADGRVWKNVRDPFGVEGWVAEEYLRAVAPTPTATPRPTVAEIAEVSEPEPTPRPSATPTITPTPVPLSMDVRFKHPEIERRDDQILAVLVSRNGVPVPEAEVSFVVDDEDPQVERVASAADEEGWSTFRWNMRRYRGTTVLRIKATTPDGGEGRAEGSFFVR